MDQYSNCVTTPYTLKIGYFESEPELIAAYTVIYIRGGGFTTTTVGTVALMRMLTESDFRS